MGIDTTHGLKAAEVVNVLMGCSRLSTLIRAAMFVLLPILGTPRLNYIPKPILGGLLLYFGLFLVVEWVYKA